jgi:hypothetical protein
MRAVAAVLVAFVAFALSWFFIATLLALMGWAVSMSGYGSDLLLIIHVLLLWVLSPGLGAAISIIVASSVFKAVPVSTIYVSFVSICAIIFLLLFAFATLLATEPFGRLVVFVMQVVAIFIGAYLGRTFSYIQASSPDASARGT